MNLQAPHETQQPQLQPPHPPQALHALHPRAQPRQPPQPPQPRAYCTPGWRASMFSLSKTKNVAKLTSVISSSLKVTCGPDAPCRTSAGGPTAAVADPPASAIDAPTTPTTGTAFFSCFFRDIAVGT